MVAQWKKILGSVAPMIGGALGGNLGEMAVSVAAKALGLPVGATEDDVAQAVTNMTPEQTLALKQADMEYLTRKDEIYAEMERDRNDDRANAREMHRKSDKSDKTFNKLVIVMDTALAAAILSALVFFGDQIPDKVEGVLYMAVGIVFTVFKTERHFLFGSSAGSRQKTEIMNK